MNEEKTKEVRNIKEEMHECVETLKELGMSKMQAVAFINKILELGAIFDGTYKWDKKHPKKDK